VLNTLMPHKCRHRRIDAAAFVPGANPTFTIPPDTTPLDEALEYLGRKDDPAVNELIVDTMGLMTISSKGRDIIGVVMKTLVELLDSGDLNKMGETGEKAFADLQHHLELLMALGFLSGTAIGFAAGLQFEEASDDEDDEGPDYEGPMV
jgi:hypothetical protein